MKAKLLFAALILTFASWRSAAQTLVLKGAWQGASNRFEIITLVRAQGETAYAIAEGNPTTRLLTLDISTPTNPTMRSSFQFPNGAGPASGLVIAGSYAYVLANARLFIVDLQDPAHPQIANTISTYGGSFRGVNLTDGLTLSGNRLFAAEGFGGMEIFELADPRSPTRKGRYYETNRYVWHVSARADAALMSSFNLTAPHNGALSVLDGALSVLDVGDLQTPRLVSSNGIAQYVKNIAWRDDYAFVGVFDEASGGGVRVFDLTNPQAPVFISAFDGLPDIDGISLAGNFAFVTTRFGLRVLDISNPLHLVEIGRNSTFSGDLSLALVGTHAFVAAGTHGVFVLDISNPAQPTRDGWFQYTAEYAGIALNGDHLYLGELINGIQILDIHDPSSPRGAGFFHTDSSTSELQQRGSRLYANRINPMLPTYGFDILDTTNPTNLALLGRYNSGVAASLAFVGEFGYRGSGGPMEIVDLRDATRPTLLKSLNLNLSTSSMRTFNGCAFTTVFDNITSYGVLDVHDPANPFLVKTYPSIPAPYSGGYDFPYDIVHCLGDGSVRTLDSSNPQAVREVGRVDPPSSANARLIRDGPLAFVVNNVNPAPVHMLDLSDPNQPKYVGTFSGITGVITAMRRNYLFALEPSTGRLLIYEASLPFSSGSLAKLQAYHDAGSIIVRWSDQLTDFVPNFVNAFGLGQSCQPFGLPEHTGFYFTLRRPAVAGENGFFYLIK